MKHKTKYSAVIRP